MQHCIKCFDYILSSHRKPNKHLNFRLLSNNYTLSAEHFIFTFNIITYMYMASHANSFSFDVFMYSVGGSICNEM